MKITALLLAVGYLLVAPAHARTFELPEANPAVVVTLPNGWKPHAVDKGVEATSPDGETYVALETATARAMERLIDDDIKFLSDQGVVIDRTSQQTMDMTMNGIAGSMMHWTGKDKDGPTAVTLGIFGVSDNLVLLMTAWSSPAGDKANGAALTDVLNSISRR